MAIKEPAAEGGLVIDQAFDSSAVLAVLLQVPSRDEAMQRSLRRVATGRIGPHPHGNPAGATAFGR
jgi:hypothetical protein